MLRRGMKIKYNTRHKVTKYEKVVDIGGLVWYNGVTHPHHGSFGKHRGVFDWRKK
jgi:hypothetical protein